MLIVLLKSLLERKHLKRSKSLRKPEPSRSNVKMKQLLLSKRKFMKIKFLQSRLLLKQKE